MSKTSELIAEAQGVVAKAIRGWPNDLLDRLAIALSTAQGEVEARWRTMETAPSFKDVLGLYFGGTDHDIRSYHVVRQDTDENWMCEGFSILAPRFWMPLPTPPQGGD